MTRPPFLLVTELAGGDEATATALWTPQGNELGPSDPDTRPATVPGVLVIEALVQTSAALLRRATDDAQSQWMLAGIDEASLSPVGWGEELQLTCRVTGRRGPTARLAAEALSGSRLVCGSGLLLVRR